MVLMCALQIAIRDVMPEATITAFDCEHCLFKDIYITNKKALTITIIEFLDTENNSGGLFNMVSSAPRTGCR